MLKKKIKFTSLPAFAIDKQPTKCDTLKFSFQKKVKKKLNSKNKPSANLKKLSF